MGLHLHRDLEFLKGQILDMGALVETAVNEAISALIDRRPELADEVVAGDDRVDEKEVAIEIDCQKILALHQPVATDLRLLLTVLKINNDLERAGDLAVNIAERARVLGSRPAMKFPAQTERLVALVRAMLRDSLDAFVNQDTALAHAVRAQDEEVDELNRQMFTELERSMRADPDTIERALHLLSCSRHLERVADLATNIAEDVVFLVDGTVIRHRRKA
jgi:phosphate transport system protein